MFRIPALLLFCSATCGVACSEEDSWTPEVPACMNKTRKGGSRGDDCKVAKDSLCAARVARLEYKCARDKAQHELNKAKKIHQKAIQKVKDEANKKHSACWTMDGLHDWLEEFSTKGQCANEHGDLFYGIRVWKPTKKDCIQMLADSPRAVGLSWEPKSYPGMPYGGLSGGCRVLYENSLGHITQANGDDLFRCYARRSSKKVVPPVTTVQDVSLERVEGKGKCLNSKGEANYAATPTSKHNVQTESTCFQMFEDAMPEAVGMLYQNLASGNTRCYVLYDPSSIGEITQSSGHPHEDYTCYKRSTPAGNRRLRAEEALPLV